MDYIKRTVRVNEKMYDNYKRLAEDENKDVTQYINEALQYYWDYKHMQNSANFINKEVLQVLRATVGGLENKINNKTNQVLSELAIQVNIQNQVLANNLEINPVQLEIYRQNAVDFLKANQRVLRLNEAIDDE